MLCLVLYVYVNVREIEAASRVSAIKKGKGVRGRSPGGALTVAIPPTANKKFLPMTPHA